MGILTFSDIESAFYFVSSAAPFVNSAYIAKERGEIFYESGYGDSDELPGDIDDAERYVSVPHKNDLELGIQLVRTFVEDRLPDKLGEVEAYFRGRGAYSRLKALLARSDLLEEWYDFEQKATESALRGWCEDSGIVIGL